MRADAYRSVSLCGAAVACSLAGDMAIYTILPVIYVDIGLSAIQVGVLLAANRFVRLLTNPLSDWLIRKVPARALMYCALLTGGAIALLYGYMPTFLIFLVLRLLWGLCWSVLRQVGIMNASGKSGHGAAARMTGIYNSIIRVGFLAGTLSSGILLDTTRIETMFAWMAAIMVAGMVPATFAFRRGEMVPLERGDVTSHSHHKTPSILAGRSTRRQAAKGFIVGAVGSGIVMSTLGYVLRNAAGTDVSVGHIVIGVATLNAIILAVRHLVGIVGGPTVGIAVDKVGIRKGEMLAFSGAAASLLAALFIPGLLPVTMSIVAFSIFETTTMIALTAEASQTSRGYAIYASAADAGAAAGPLLAWILIEAAAFERVGFLVGALLYAAGILLVVIETRNKGE